ncbi:unnamed protein product [Rhizophagus irregularis]|nr:unnamed protein product [Rhizophagus irregularis]
MIAIQLLCDLLQFLAQLLNLKRQFLSFGANFQLRVFGCVGIMMLLTVFLDVEFWRNNSAVLQLFGRGLNGSSFLVSWM